MADPAKRLDDVSANLAEVLRHADALLEEWSQFGASVRAQVEREAAQVGRAVADGAGGAVEKSLATLRSELSQLEKRVRAAQLLVVQQRATDRRLLAGIAIGVAIVIAMLAFVIVRGPTVAEVAPVPAAVPSAPPPDARPIDAAPPPVDAAPPPPPADAAKPARHR